MGNLRQFETERARIFENLGGIVQAMASPARLRILQILSNRPCSVEALSLMIGESIANTSQHLQKLLKAGIVRSDKQGVSRIYQFATPQVLKTWISLQELAGALNPQIRDDEEKICPPELLPKIEIDQVLKKVNSGRAVLVDVRDPEEVQSTPASKALSIPAQEFQERWKELPKSKTIFVFCRGRYCAMANSAVELLRRKGFEAYRLRENSYQLENHQSST